MSTAHTPGPWCVWSGAIYQDDGNSSGNLVLIPLESGSLMQDIKDGEWDDHENAKPEDLRLIAAAPELLRVVQDFRDKLTTYASVYPGDKQLRRQLADCDAAIAKATGEAA